MPTGSGKSGTVETLGVKMSELSSAQMLAELDALVTDEPVNMPIDGAKTILEWRAEWKCSAWKAGDRVKRGVKAGLMEAVKRPRPLINGGVRQTTCYRWVGE